MKKDRDDCRTYQEELAFGRGTDLLAPGFVDHHGRCLDCQTFAENVSELVHLIESDRTEPSPDLVARAMKRLSPELAARAREGFWLRARLALAGLVSLPVILGLNGLLIWFVYTMFALWLSVPIAIGAASVITVSTLLGLSLAYGSLPLMAHWGLELRWRS